MLGRLKFGLDEAIEEMLDTLPKKLFRSKTTTFLDPAMGGGQFVAAIERRLRKYGHSDSNIADRVFGLELSWRVKIAVNKMKLIGEYGRNYEVADFLESEMAMKFDVIVGNPPFSEKGKEHDREKLWISFLRKSLNLIKDDGVIAMITPNGWVSSTNKAHNIFKNRLVCANISKEISDMFGSTGGSQRFGWWVLKNNSKYKTPSVTFDNGEGDIDILKTPCSPPKSGNSNSFTIVEKMFEKQSTSTIAWRRTDKDPLRNVISLPLAKSQYYTIKWHKIEDYFPDKNLGRYVYECDSNEGHILSNNLNLKLYQLLRWELRSGAAIASNFGLLPVPKTKMTNKKLYNYFGFTQEEINYIEENVK